MSTSLLLWAVIVLLLGTLSPDLLLAHKSCADWDVKKREVDAMEEYFKTHTQKWEKVKKYVMFIGFGKSGHSWVAAAMDAAPNALIANEYNAFFRWNHTKEMSRKMLFHGLAHNSYVCGMKGRMQVYDYTIKGFWQGKVKDGTNLEVIGDKKGGGTTTLFRKWHEMGVDVELFDKFMEMVEVEPRIIVVLRNPLSLVATHHVRSGTNLDHNIEQIIRDQDFVFWLYNNLAEKHQWYFLSMEDFAKNTEEEFVKLCKFSSLDCPRELVEKVVEQTHHEFHESWRDIVWTEKQWKTVNNYIEENMSPYYKPVEWDEVKNNVNLKK